MNPELLIWPRGPVAFTLAYPPATATPPYLPASGKDHRTAATPTRLTARLLGKGRSDSAAVSELLFNKFEKKRGCIYRRVEVVARRLS